MNLDFNKRTYQEVSGRRKAYLATTTVPLDGMWENAFLPMADHWEVSAGNQSIGVCSINADGKMLGFDVRPSVLQRPAFVESINRLGVTGAFASTAEPAYLALCADHQTSMSVNALMYGENTEKLNTPKMPIGMGMRVAEPGDLETAVSFGVAAIQADKDWLEGYFDERIQKNELFGLWQGPELIATGECRISPNQKKIADVGMIVGAAHRKKGLATLMLQFLRTIGAQDELKLICSTESTNIAAQKAIERAGFVSEHRILSFEF